MPFEKGHKLDTGRPKGSLNRELSEAKKILNTIIFDKQKIVDDFNELDVRGRMEFRVRMAKFVIPEQKAVEVESKAEMPRLTLDQIAQVYNANDNELPSHSA